MAGYSERIIGDPPVMVIRTGWECRCECAEGGDCEHVFTHWDAYPNGLGGEQICVHCGLPAIMHAKVATGMLGSPQC